MGDIFIQPQDPGGTNPLGGGTTTTTGGADAIGEYRHSAPAPIPKRVSRDLYSLVKEFEAMED